MTTLPRDRAARNALLRAHHYRWKKASGRWLLVSPNGNEVTEREAEAALRQELQSLPPSPQAWARQKYARQALFLDTETTGLDELSEVIEVALVGADGAVLVNTLVQCLRPIPAEATQIHGITNTMLLSAPTFQQMWTQLTPYLQRDIVIFNAAYDVPLLQQTARRHNLQLPRLNSDCLMIQCFRSMTPATQKASQRISYPSLAAACRYFGIAQQGEHRALSDAQAAREVLLRMAQVDA